MIPLDDIAPDPYGDIAAPDVKEPFMPDIAVPGIQTLPFWPYDGLAILLPLMNTRKDSQMSASVPGFSIESSGQ